MKLKPISVKDDLPRDRQRVFVQIVGFEDEIRIGQFFKSGTTGVFYLDGKIFPIDVIGWAKLPEGWE